MRYLLATVLLTAACAPAAPGIELLGIPVDQDAVMYAVALVNEDDFQAPVESVDAGANLVIRYVQALQPDTLLGATRDTIGGHEITLRYAGPCLARSALVHELLHARYGDAGHGLGAKLWGARVWHINNKVIVRFCPTEVQDGGLR